MMAYRTLVYFYPLQDAEPQYVGEIEFKQPPVVGGAVSFSYKGKRETGQVEQITPPDWERRGMVPAVHIAKGQKADAKPNWGVSR